METWVRTIASDIYSLGLVLLQMLLGQPDVGNVKQAATQLREGASFLDYVDPHMPGDKPVGILEELFCLALACIRTDNPNYRPRAGCPEGAERDHTTVLARVEAALENWSQPQVFTGQLEHFRKELRHVALQKLEL